MLEIPYGTCYSKTKEEQLPTSGCPHKQWLEKSTLVTRSKLGWFFYALKHYLINVNTNVSNARMNRPKVMRSLKSNLLFISTTPILCRIEVSHPVTQLFHGLYFIVSYVDILNRTKLSREVGSIPRLVSIDKYNFIVNHLVENVDIIEIVLF